MPSTGVSTAMDERLLDVDQHGVLRPPWSLWFCTAFLLRHWILLVVVAVTSMRSPGTAQWALAALTPTTLLIEAPMWLLVGAWARRLPAGGPWARRLWQHGREVITATAALNLAWSLYYLWGRDEWNPWPERFIAILAGIELGIIIGVWRSALYRQLFREFPAPSATKAL